MRIFVHAIATAVLTLPACMEPDAAAAGSAQDAIVLTGPAPSPPSARLGLNGDLFDPADAANEQHPWQARSWILDAGDDVTLRLPQGSDAMWARPFLLDEAQAGDGAAALVPRPGWGRDIASIDATFLACASGVLDTSAVPNAPATWECVGSGLEWPDGFVGDANGDGDYADRGDRRHDNWRKQYDNAVSDAAQQTSFVDELIDASLAYDGLHVIWVANVVTASAAENIKTIEYMVQHGVDVVAVELGNELYFSLYRVPSAFDDYYAHVKPLIDALHASPVPGVANIPISMPIASFEYMWEDVDGDGGANEDWNAAAAAKLVQDPSAFDAITVHFYESRLNRKNDCDNPYNMWPQPKGYAFPADNDGNAGNALAAGWTSMCGAPAGTSNPAPGVTIPVGADGALGVHAAAKNRFTQAWSQFIDGKKVDGTANPLGSGADMFVSELVAAKQAFPSSQLLVTEFGLKDGDHFNNTVLHGAWMFRAFQQARTHADYLCMQQAVGDHLVAAVGELRSKDDEARVGTGETMVRRISYWAFAFAEEVMNTTWLGVNAGTPATVVVTTNATNDMLFTNGNAVAVVRTLQVPTGYQIASVSRQFVSGAQPYSSAGHIGIMSAAQLKSLEIVEATREAAKTINASSAQVTIPPYSFGYVRVNVTRKAQAVGSASTSKPAT